MSAPPSFGGPLDWPQYAGGPEHDTGRERGDGIEVPRVHWFVRGLAGVPSLRNGDLYSGGVVLARLDPDSGELRGLTSPLAPDQRILSQLVPALREGGAQPELLAAFGEAMKDQETAQAWAEFAGRLERFDDPESHSIAGAPVITPRFVIVRDLDDGNVRAYDRELMEELWCHKLDSEQRPESARVPLCLADDGTLLVVKSNRVVALRSSDGRELWRFTCNGRIRMAPACADGRVFFGMDKGLFFALSLGTGEKLWQVSAGTFSSTTPSVVRGNVFAADQGPTPWQTPDEDSGPSDPTASGYLHSYDARTGLELWKLGFNGARLTPLGLFERGRRAFAAFGEELVDIDLDAGRGPTLVRTPTPAAVRGTPAVVGESLVFACGDGHLYVHELPKLAPRWSFHVPQGAEIEDFVHTGERIYVATSIGLFCLGNDPAARPLEPGFVLEWEGDTEKPLFDLGR